MRIEIKNLIKIVIIFIVISVFGVCVYAENLETPDTGNGSTGNTESGTNTEEVQTTPEPEPPKEDNTTEEVPNENESTNTENNSDSNNSDNNTTEAVTKSNNANLNNLGINPHDFSGFTPSNTTYNVIVPEDTKSIEIYAQVADSKASVTGIGTKSLEIGKNTFVLVVTAEDGTKKNYTINITRDGENVEEEQDEEDKKIEENEDISVEESLEVVGGKEGLKSLNIENGDLSPSFKSNIYEYSLKYEGNSDSLKIDFEAAVSTYVVEIMGNNNLDEGDNVISIFVSDESGNNIATYQIVVDKYLVLETETTNTSMYIWIGIVSLLTLLILIAIIRKVINRRKIKDHLENKNDENRYMDKEQDELPKGLAKKSIDNNNLDAKKFIDSNVEEKTKVEDEKQIARNQFLDEYESKLKDQEKI